jgi:hypothetical protein
LIRALPLGGGGGFSGAWPLTPLALAAAAATKETEEEGLCLVRRGLGRSRCLGRWREEVYAIERRGAEVGGGDWVG